MDVLFLTRASSFGLSILFAGLTVGGFGLVVLADNVRLARETLLRPRLVSYARFALFIGAGLTIMGVVVLGLATVARLSLS